MQMRLVTLSIVGALLLALAGMLACQQNTNVSPPVASLNNSLQVWLEVPAEARAGELVHLKFYVKNVSDRTLEIWGGGLPYDFTVVTPEGAVVWRWANTRAMVQVPIVIKPNMVKEYQVGWSQRYRQDRSVLDQSGPITLGAEFDPVPPGVYLVRGTFEFSLTTDSPDIRLVTDPLRMVITPTQYPEYPPRSVQLTGTASEIQ